MISVDHTIQVKMNLAIKLLFWPVLFTRLAMALYATVVQGNKVALSEIFARYAGYL